MEVFTYNNNKILVIKKDDDIWFKARQVAKILEYSNTKEAIIYHVHDDDKIRLKSITNDKGSKSLPFTNRWSSESLPLHPDTIFINESGLYSLILRSKMEKAKEFKRWVTKEVLPSIRKTGKYEFNNKQFKMLTFNIQSEYDLHTKVVNFIRNRYKKALIIASIGENQINDKIRLKSYNMGYQKGSPDIIIQNLHKYYSGFVIEFKSPKGNGIISNSQTAMLNEYKNNNHKVLVSNDYDEIILAIVDYFNGVRIKCQFCSNKLKSYETLNNHLKYFHKHK